MRKRNSTDEEKKKSQRGMSKTNSPDKNEGSTGCLTETQTQIFKKIETPHKTEASTGCVRKTPQMENRSQRGMCKRKSPDKN